VPVGTIRSRLSRDRDALRNCGARLRNECYALIVTASVREGLNACLCPSTLQRNLPFCGFAGVGDPNSTQWRNHYPCLEDRHCRPSLREGPVLGSSWVRQAWQMACRSLRFLLTVQTRFYPKRIIDRPALGATRSTIRQPFGARRRPHGKKGTILGARSHSAAFPVDFCRRAAKSALSVSWFRRSLSRFQVCMK